MHHDQAAVCDRRTLLTLQGILRRQNLYVQRFETAVEWMKEDLSLNLHLRIVHLKKGGKDPRRYNCHTASEVDVLIDTVEDEPI